MSEQPPVANNLGAIWASLTQSQREGVLKEAAAEGLERFKLYRETLREASGLRQPRPDVRLQMYERRTPERWALIRERQPQMAKDDMDDWRKLLKEREPVATPSADRPRSIQPAVGVY